MTVAEVKSTPTDLARKAILAYMPGLVPWLLIALSPKFQWASWTFLSVALASISFGGWYWWQLTTGIKADLWAEDELNSASAWIEARANKLIAIAVAIWIVAAISIWWTGDAHPMTILLAQPFILTIQGLRNALAPPNSSLQGGPWWSTPLRTRLAGERKFLKSSGTAPPPRIRKKFELYQYPVRRPTQTPTHSSQTPQYSETR